MERNTIKKCPMCAKKLKPVNGRMVCKDCGYNVGISGVYVQEEQSASFTGGFNYEQNHAKAKEKPQKRYKASKSDILILIIAIAIIAGGIYGASQADKRTPNVQFVTENYEELIKYIQKEERIFPKSEFFQQFVSDIFGKDYKDVSEEEYASITALHIYRNENKVDYAINDGDYIEYFYDGSLYIGTSDLKCFTGLKHLNVEGRSLLFDDLDGLEFLTEVQAGNSAGDLSQFISHCENITVLGIYDTFFSNSMEGIDKFQNVVSLYIDADYVEDISGISTLKNLRELTINDGNRITNLGEIANLTELTKLSITSNQLKNLSILRGMKNLCELTVNESEVSDLSALGEYKDTLKKVELLENYKINDYSTITELTELEELGIGCTYNAILPSFKELKRLEKLSLEGVEDVGAAALAENITELRLKRCSLTNLSAISNLKSLKYIRIDDSSSYIDNLHPLTELVNLEILDISNTYVFGNVEELFSLPKLEKLVMNKCRVGIDFEKIPRNENLKILHMNDITVLKYDISEDTENYFHSDGKEVNLSEHLDLFLNFPNMEELYIAGNEVDNLEFAAELTKLERLDISNNSVSSLKPLESLQYLDIVWCGKNTITDSNSLGDKVKVFMT